MGRTNILRLGVWDIGIGEEIMKIYWLHGPTNCFNDGSFYQFFRQSSALDIDDGLVDKWLNKMRAGNVDFVTLNPVILNFLDDDFAKENVYVRTKNGYKKLGDVEKVQFKFRILGPGEICCDTDFSILE